MLSNLMLNGLLEPISSVKIKVDGVWKTVSVANIKVNGVWKNVNISINYTSTYPPAHNDTYVKATSRLADNYWPYFSTDPAKSLTGAFLNNQWLSLGATNQRFHIDLGSAVIVRRIYYENSHDSGAVTNSGAKNFTFWGSNTATAFATLTYATDTDWTQIISSQFDQHTGSNVADPKYILVPDHVGYRYYALKIADGWGNGIYIGLRRVELQVIG
jgi:hypothetical protein